MIGVKLLVTMLMLGILAEKGSGLDCYKCKGKGCGDPFSSDEKEKETCGASTPPASRPTTAPTVTTSTTTTTTTTAPTTTTTAATATTIPVIPTIPEFPTPTTAPTTVPIPTIPGFPTPITVPTTVPIPTIPEFPTPTTAPTTVSIPPTPEFPTPITVPTTVPIPTIPEFPTPTTAPTTVSIPPIPEFPTPITVPTTVPIPTIGTFPTPDSVTVRKEDTETTKAKYPAVHLLSRRSRQPNRDENYVCVKYTEKDGDDDIIVRGCASTSQNDDVCKGKTNCNTCTNDLCNASNKMSASIFTIASTTLILIVLTSQL